MLSKSISTETGAAAFGLPPLGKVYFSVIDKHNWGDGPWKFEPDKVSWTDPLTDLPCLIVRGPLGALCGYVGVEPGHPLHGVHDNESAKIFDCDGDCGEDGHDACTVDGNLTAHGGVNFSSGCAHGDEASSICHIPEPGRSDDVWWFGLDCAHSGDVTPKVNALLKSLSVDFLRPTPRRGEIYRDLAYVKDQVEELALQLKALG
jgi:hypothetical protein